MAVIEQLRKCGALWHHTAITHRYPYDWRTKKPIIQRAAAQWFCRLDGLQSAALSALAAVSLVPAAGAQQLAAVVASRGEWCISRQRHWGLPIPVFYEADTGKPLLTSESVQHVAQLISKHGSDVWWTAETHELLAPQYRTDGKTYVRGYDTMDVWYVVTDARGRVESRRIVECHRGSTFSRVFNPITLAWRLLPTTNLAGLTRALHGVRHSPLAQSLLFPAPQRLRQSLRSPVPRNFRPCKFPRWMLC